MKQLETKMNIIARGNTIYQLYEPSNLPQCTFNLAKVDFSQVWRYNIYKINPPLEPVLHCSDINVNDCDWSVMKVFWIHWLFVATRWQTTVVKSRKFFYCHFFYCLKKTEESDESVPKHKLNCRHAVAVTQKYKTGFRAKRDKTQGALRRDLLLHVCSSVERKMCFS